MSGPGPRPEAHVSCELEGTPASDNGRDSGRRARDDGDGFEEGGHGEGSGSGSEAS